jgi:hypothetical protein
VAISGGELNGTARWCHHTPTEPASLSPARGEEARYASDCRSKSGARSSSTRALSSLHPGRQLLSGNRHSSESNTVHRATQSVERSWRTSGQPTAQYFSTAQLNHPGVSGDSIF